MQFLSVAVDHQGDQKTSVDKAPLKFGQAHNQGLVQGNRSCLGKAEAGVRFAYLKKTVVGEEGLCEG